MSEKLSGILKIINGNIFTLLWYIKFNYNNDKSFNMKINMKHMNLILGIIVNYNSLHIFHLHLKLIRLNIFNT